PQPRETHQETAGFDRSHRRAQSGPQASGALRARVGLRELGNELGTSQALQREFAFELPDVFAFEAHDLERLAYRGVALERFQNAEQKALDPRNGIGPVGAPQRKIDLVDHRYGDLLAHGEEQRVLVGEMPVDRPARHAGRGGDLPERRAGHSLAGENLACRTQDALPGALGFPFRSTQIGSAASLTRVRGCIYSHPSNQIHRSETLSQWRSFTLGRPCALPDCWLGPRSRDASKAGPILPLPIRLPPAFRPRCSRWRRSACPSFSRRWARCKAPRKSRCAHAFRESFSSASTTRGISCAKALPSSRSIPSLTRSPSPRPMRRWRRSARARSRRGAKPRGSRHSPTKRRSVRKNSTTRCRRKSSRTRRSRPPRRICARP